MGPHFRINDETDIYVIEDIIQKYLKENYEMYGFTEISGPFKRGPDFKGKIKNRNVRIEVENTIDDYFKHGHHKDPRFDDVSILIVFINYGVSKDLKRKLPKTIIEIIFNHFYEWYKPILKNQMIRDNIDYLASQFRKVFIENCSASEGDMAHCPDCEYCPYFDEDPMSNKVMIFEEMAINFFFYKDLNFHSDDFNVTKIRYNDIVDFYNNNILSYL